MTTGIYALTFDNGSVYVGQAIDILDRYKDHCKKLQANTHSAKMLSAYNSSNRSLPILSVKIDCHRDFLDLFESFMIHDTPESIRLNTAIPTNLLNGATQRTVDILCENRHNSIVNLLDKLASLNGKVDGLKLSLGEAEEVIDELETKRAQEEIIAAGKALVAELQNKIDALEKEAQANLDESEDYQGQLFDAQEEIKRLKSRSLWDRIINK